MNQSTPVKGFTGFLQKFLCLRTAPRELWIIYFAYILENLAYKAGAASVLTLWLSDDLGFDDVKAGAMVAGWSAIMTLITVFVGSLTDALGIRRTFLLGFIICLISRLVMTSSTNPWIALPGGLYLQAIGLALMVPVMIMAVKRYTNAAQRSMAFSLYYALMNLGYACGDWILDTVRAKPPIGLGEHGSWLLPWTSIELSTYRVLILLSVIFTVPGLLLIWGFVRNGVEMTETGVKITPQVSSTDIGTPWLLTLWNNGKATAIHTGKIFSGLWGQPKIYQFLLFMSLVVGVKMIFFHLNFTFPKFAIRELGDGAPFAKLTGMLNSLLIVVLVPICGALTQKVTAYRMVTVGSLISALSVFFMAMPPEWFKSLADGWLGQTIATRLGVAGQVNPLFVSIFFFVIFLSIGEALWSPRLYEYSAAIAPRGQEASYMALSLLPFFGAKLLVGGISGPLLTHYCPATGPRNSGMMWLIIGSIALITPVGAYLFRNKIQVQEEGRNK